VRVSSGIWQVYSQGLGLCYGELAYSGLLSMSGMACHSGMRGRNLITNGHTV
jgi:hypothetical protein